MKTKQILSTIGVMLVTTTASFAQISGPTFPPPGGVTTSGSGSPGLSSGRENYYTGFNSSLFSQLDWTFSEVANPYSNSQGATGDMAFAGYNPATGEFTWNSTANTIWGTTVGTVSIGTKLIVQLQPYTGVAGPLGSGWLTPTTAGAAGITTLPSAQSVLDVLNDGGVGNAYQVWFQYQTASGIPLLNYYNSFNNNLSGEGINTSASGNFYYVLAPVPEPSTFALMGVAGLGLLLRRRK